MSKRLKNYPDPNEVMEDHGADVLRYLKLYLIIVYIWLLHLLSELRIYVLGRRELKN